MHAYNVFIANLQVCNCLQHVCMHTCMHLLPVSHCFYACMCMLYVPLITGCHLCMLHGIVYVCILCNISVQFNSRYTYVSCVEIHVDFLSHTYTARAGYI